MLKNRLIVCLLLKNGSIVQSKDFKWHQRLGNPTTIVERLSNWTCDELIYLDIGSEDSHDLNRDDLKGPNRGAFEDIIQDVSKSCFMPLTVGGRIKNLQDIHKKIKYGADKVSINTEAFKNPSFITEGAKEFGSQCIVVSIDAKLSEGKHFVYTDRGKVASSKTPVEWAKEVEDRGAGEILINSIDRDGKAMGYDIELISSVVDAVNIPVIACGGVGSWEHFEEGLREAKPSAVAASNIFHYTENSVFNSKKFLYDSGLNVREPALSFQDKAKEVFG
ncbi:imidazole glycerol phosphate synthase cyclase subunit [SAR86 cluster bacterium]|nr:imidazole glycerol phosphate synthase cyclase subunit [SAR86 cluster bacterium]